MIKTTYYRHLPEIRVEGKPLGRHVKHDPRSLQYLVEADGTVASARWERKTPVLDQGNLGSCTGNACCGVLGTQTFYETLLMEIQAGQLALDEDEAVDLYATATALDNYQGTYPPSDTGSDGLSVAKAAKANGLISGYKHITSLAAAHTAIQKSPFIVGTVWLSGMDDPDRNGLVHATGVERGGHEYECVGYDLATDLWEFVNSWGTGFGKAGHFFYSSADFARLLHNNGDATVFVPNNQPTPTPEPPPVVDSFAVIEKKFEEFMAWLKEFLAT